MEESLVVLGTVGVTGAGTDDHDWFLDGLPRRALELHLDGLGIVGGAAAAVTADSAEPGLVGQQAGAVLVLQMDGLQRLLRAETLFSLLQEKRRSHVRDDGHFSEGSLRAYGITCYAHSDPSV